MKFGIGIRKKLTGAELTVRIQQVCAILPVVFLLIGSGFPALLANRGFFSRLFELGLSSLPRLEELGLSCLYRLTRSEVVVAFLLLGIALLLGLVSVSLLKGKTARTVRWVMVVWIAADLVLRLLPLQLNRAFGSSAAVTGFAMQAVCLMLTLADLLADRKEKKKNEG